MKAIFRFSLYFLSIIMLLVQCTHIKDTSQLHSPDLFVKTVRKLNEVVLENNFSPVVASRNYAYSTIAAYEVLAALESSKYRSLQGQIKGFPQMPQLSSEQAALVDYPLSSLLALIQVGNQVTFPEGSMMQTYKEVVDLAEQSGLSSKAIDISTKFAKQVADSILKWSNTDNYNKTRSAPKFTITDEVGRWVPTPPMYSPALEPHWMKIRPLVLKSSDQFKPIRPPVYNIKNKNSAFYKELMEVKNAVDNLTQDQKEMATFWDDNPFALHVEGHVMMGEKKFSPPGHWTNIVGLLGLQEHVKLDKLIAIYAHVCIAIFDANISAWDEKYRSNRIRPETVINAHFDNLWKPFLQTPAFPAYTSGHSVTSNAVAVVLSKYYPNTPFTDTTQQVLGIKARKFESIMQAGAEASISRLYGGIHYRSDLDEGLKQGIAVGKWVLANIHLNKQN